MCAYIHLTWISHTLTWKEWCISCGEIVFAVFLVQVNSVFLVLVLRSIYISKSSQDSRSKKGQKNRSLAR